MFSQSSVMESTGLDSYNMDPDWLDSFLEDPVLNDRMMSDALQPAQPISNEHSYSLANNDATDIDAIKNEPVDNGTHHHHDKNPSTPPHPLLDLKENHWWSNLVSRNEHYDERGHYDVKFAHFSVEIYICIWYWPSPNVSSSRDKHMCLFFSDNWRMPRFQRINRYNGVY